MALTRIHVNQHVIRSNRKHQKAAPVLTVKHRGTNVYAHEVVIDRPCKVVYRPDKPLSCGAQVWVEVEGEVLPIVRDDLDSSDRTLDPQCSVA